MEKRTVTINGHELPFYRCHTLVIGSGAAALNCACHLVRFRVKDVLIVTAKLGGGTSNQAGSDKQTYYKLSFGRRRTPFTRWPVPSVRAGRCTGTWL